MDLEQTIAENIKRLRLSAGLSQRDLADRVPTTPEYLSKIERRKRGCSLHMLASIADEFGVAPVDLLLPSLGTGSDAERLDHLVALARRLPPEKLDLVMRLAGALIPEQTKSVGM